MQTRKNTCLSLEADIDEPRN